ncbi:MAG TPA: hypothetical protein VH934_12930 [Xanthobacteraceae bacterium]|jgi:hypothetical protein
MEWDISPERMAHFRDSIRPIRTDLSLREVLSEDFPQDCASLPISGGWGYTREDAIVFVRDRFQRPSAPDFVGLEYHIAQKIIYEELIIFRAEDDCFSGIDMTPKLQRLIVDGEKKYDCLDFTVSCWSDFHWESLKSEWEDNDFGRRPGFDVEGHYARKRAAQIEYERQFWFDITEVVDPPAPMTS